MRKYNLNAFRIGYVPTVWLNDFLFVFFYFLLRYIETISLSLGVDVFLKNYPQNSFLLSIK